MGVIEVQKSPDGARTHVIAHFGGPDGFKTNNPGLVDAISHLVSVNVTTFSCFLHNESELFTFH